MAARRTDRSPPAPHAPAEAPLRPPDEGDLLTIAQVRRILPVAKSTIYGLVESGQLPHYRVGATRRREGRILVARADLDAFIHESRHTRPVAPKRLDIDAIHVRVRNGGRPAQQAVD